MYRYAYQVACQYFNLFPPFLVQLFTYLYHLGQDRSIPLTAPARLWASANSAKHVLLQWKKNNVELGRSLAPQKRLLSGADKYMCNVREDLATKQDL